MPTPSLPWFKVWIGATAHAKARQLNDATFRTWVELLDAAAQQPRRGRFKNRKEAAMIVRRPPSHVATLIAATLIDETPDGLTMHDWDAWQRWRKEEVIDTGSTHDGPPDQHTINAPTTNGSAHDGPAMDESLSPLHSSLFRERDGEEDTKTEKKTPPTSAEVAPQKVPRRRVTSADPKFRQELEDDFWEAFGSRQAAKDCIDVAMSHKQLLACTDQQAYLRNWIRKDAESAARRRGARAIPTPEPSHQGPSMTGRRVQMQPGRPPSKDVA